LKAVLRGAVDRDASARFESAAAFCEALRRLDRGP
jgi:hypothetical protein